MAIKANIVIDQGSTFSTQINVANSSGSPFDLSNYTVRSQFRKTYSSLNAYNFAVSANSSGAIVLELDASASSNVSPGRYVYDVTITDQSDNTNRIIEGQVTFNPSVSR
jgi:hypothetical protein